MVSSDDRDEINAVAVIGMSGRFPGAKNVREFWRNLVNGLESISTFSPADLARDGLDPRLLQQPGFINRAGTLEDIEYFDAALFGYSPREAEITDPQQRLFLECAWETLEDAGYDPDRYTGLVGVYAGVAMSKYLYGIFANREVMASVGAFQAMLGNDKDHLTTRAAYKLNLRGPAVTVQTTCSTSLVAAATACHSLLNYECDLALAGGASISVPQRSGGFYQEGGVSSPDGRCRAFDARAQGTVGGNGVGVVLLKRLSEAVADGDTIRAVIKGAAINNDGSNKVGYSAPSLDGQANVIAMAQTMAGVNPETISYVEAHGTGTPIGDPIEIAALTRVFRARTDKKNYCAIGSVKTNIGHLDPAAGVAGLIKTVLALEHETLPPSLHFERPNPRIDFANSPFHVITEARRWERTDTPRRAGVSSFGIGGTNAHLVVEEAPPRRPAASRRPWHIIPISARTRTALETATRNLVQHLDEHPATSLADAAFTCAVGRRVLAHRRVLLCRDNEPAAVALQRSDSVYTYALQQSVRKRVVFMFSGQGAQYVHMGAELYRTHPAFRAQVDRSADLIAPHLGFDVRDVLFPEPGAQETASRRLRETAVTQPALFIIEYSLASLLMTWGVQPRAMIGHSIGEYVAACIAGVFSLEDALAVVVARGRLMQEMPAGAMLAVAQPQAEVALLLTGEVSLAAVNGPAQCVISGPIEAITEVKSTLASRGLFCRSLQTSHAFHSSMMDPVVDRFTEILRGVALHPPSIPYVSNVSGGWVSPEEATSPEYWGEHLRKTVSFGDGLGTLLKEPESILVEVGPGHALTVLAGQQQTGEPAPTVLPSMRRQGEENPSDILALLKCVGRLWLEGVPIDWAAYFRDQGCHRVPLPTYPFERQKYWIAAPSAVNAAAAPVEQRQSDISRWFSVPVWKRTEPRAGVAIASTGRQHRWLVFIDNCRVGEALVRTLQSEQQEVTTVFQGDEFTRIDDRHYAIHPSRREDYAMLISTLRAQNRSPEMCVHLWNVTADPTVMNETAGFDRCQERSYFSVLFLVQAFAEQLLTHPIQLAVVSDDLHAVPAGGCLHAEKATVLGLCKVVQQEYPNITCRCVDVTLRGEGPPAEAANVVLSELRTCPPDPVVAYRDNDRWVQAYDAVELSEVHESTTRLRKEGVYLIIGGLGNIGLVLAEHLARTDKARLVLVQRSVFPAEANWQLWLATHAADDPISHRIRKLLEIQKLGAQILVLRADVANVKEMSEVFRRTAERFGAIHGVVHAAGIVGPAGVRPLRDTDDRTSELHFRPKAHGLYALGEILQGRTLDFCLLCSSLSSILGGLGLGAYSAANAFMDAFAQQRDATAATRWISVNWDGWRLTGAPGPDAREPGIVPAGGARAFRRALSVAPQVVVARGDLQERLNRWARLQEVRQADERPSGALTAQHARPELATPYAAPERSNEQAIAAVWQELLGIDRVGLHDNFFDLGGHSLLAIQAISRLRDTLQQDIPVQTLFDHPTVSAMSAALQQTQPSDQDEARLAEVLDLVERLSPEEVQRLLEQSESIRPGGGN